MKKPALLIVIGLVLLIVGGIMQFTGGAPGADPAIAQKCRAEVQARGAGDDMMDRCKTAAFASAMTSHDASEAARSISAANSSEIGSNALAMFLVGVGLALTIGGFVLRRKRSSL